MKQMKLTHKATEDKHETVRERARTIAMASFPLVVNSGNGQAIYVKDEVTLGGIDFKTKMQIKHWESSQTRRSEIDISWFKLSASYAWANPKRFELAIWHRDLLLCGLALGRPTWSAAKLRLDFLEANPETTPLSGIVTDLTIIAARAYALAIGATQLRIMNPINEKVKSHYLRNDRGFSYDQRGNYCYKDLI